METAEAAEHREPRYVLIWWYLLGLTVVEVGVATWGVTHLNLPRTLIIWLLVGLAIWKAMLVALYFMHLRFERLRIALVALAPVPLAFIFVLAVLTEFVW